jgi:hypothetical protein
MQREELAFVVEKTSDDFTVCLRFLSYLVICRVLNTEVKVAYSKKIRFLQQVQRDRFD